MKRVALSLALLIITSVGFCAQSKAQPKPPPLEFRHLVGVHYKNAKHKRPPDLYALDVDIGKDGKAVYTFRDRKGKTVKQEQVLKQSKVILTVADVKPIARVEKDPQVHTAVIMLQFTELGKKKFTDFTRKQIGEILAIMIDGRILSAPTINEPILAGRAVIRDKFTVAEAQAVVDKINAAATAAATGKH